MKEKARNYYPQFYDSAISFLREEVNGTFSLMVRNHPELTFLKINKMTKFILNCCNGKNSMYEIKEMIYNTYNVSVTADVETDIFYVIKAFWRLGAIRFNGSDPFEDMYLCKKNNFTFKYLLEKEACEYFVSLDQDKDAMISPYIDSEYEYCERSIQKKWYSGTEGYFQVEYKDEPILRLSVKPLNQLQGFEIQSVYILKDIINLSTFIEDFYLFIQKCYELNFAFKISKEDVVFVWYSSQKETGERIGLKYKGTLDKEINLTDINVFSSSFSKPL